MLSVRGKKMCFEKVHFYNIKQSLIASATLKLEGVLTRPLVQPPASMTCSGPTMFTGWTTSTTPTQVPVFYSPGALLTVYTLWNTKLYSTIKCKTKKKERKETLLPTSFSASRELPCFGGTVQLSSVSHCLLWSLLHLLPLKAFYHSMLIIASLRSK